MADLTDSQAAQSVKIVGSDSTGLETNTIGAVGDRLKVDSTTVVTSGSPQYYLDNNQVFSAATDVSMASAGTDNPLVLLRNPIGSGKIVYIMRITCGISVANVAARFNLYANPTVTANGTALSNFQRNIGNSPTSGSVLATTLPTTSSLGSRIAGTETGQNSNSAEIGADFIIAIQPGNSILLTGDPLSNNRNSILTFVWAEV